MTRRLPRPNTEGAEHSPQHESDISAPVFTCLSGLTHTVHSMEYTDRRSPRTGFLCFDGESNTSVTSDPQRPSPDALASTVSSAVH